jgi:hypothetical protein
MKMSQELNKNKRELRSPGRAEHGNTKLTSFMGVNINPKGPENLMVLKALAHPSSTILGIVEFVEVTEFKLNMVLCSIIFGR